MGLTQQQLAARINYSTVALKKIEAEERRPSAQIIQQLAEIFEIPQNEYKSFARFARGDWQAVSSGDTGDTPWHVSQIIHSSNLPISITSFIGREKERDEIIKLIGKNRLVTIAGVGGIGKTCLALQVGQKLRNDYPDGVWFIGLDSLSESTLVPQTVASAFDIRQGSSDQPLLERLIYSLHQRTTLLLLDNCEHLLDACAELITTLLINCPNLKVLVTSREILDLEGEATYYVPTLSIPEQGEISVPKTSNHESIQLFTERAGLVLSSFHLTADNIQATVNICRRLDGIPLAIEMAAARADILSVDEILRQLNHCFDLLVGKSRTVLPRHQTMRASMDWSWGLLGKAEQIFMRQLSVFAGGWTRDSAQAVCKGNALDLTSALVKKSLIMVQHESSGGTRYRFHEIVHQYARERLVDSDEEENTRVRHLKYFLQLSEQAESALRGPAQIEWNAHLNNEHDNIRAALKWAETNDVEAGLYLSARLKRFWENFAVREGARWLAEFLQKLESKHYPLARSKALFAQVLLSFWAHDLKLANAAALESLDLSRACGDKIGEIDALCALAGVSDFKAPTEKVELYKQALVLSKSIRDPWRQAYILSTLGGYTNILSQSERAAALYEKLGDLEYSSSVMLYLSMRHRLDGNLPSAQKWLKKVLKVSHSLNNKSLKAAILHQSGCTALLEGDYKRAQDDLGEAQEIAQALGNRMLLLWTRVRLGYVVLQEGDLNEAHDIFAQTAREFQKDEMVMGIVFALEGMACLKASVERHLRAAYLIGWADIIRQKLGDPRPFIEQVDVDKIISACIANMGEIAFSDAYDEGQKMSLDEAVAYALELAINP
jgi:predicted ATPase/DNA-binding XRE family transcriptional regulator